jgi:hypothetical protein
VEGIESAEVMILDPASASSCPAKAGHPVNTDLAVYPKSRWLLDRPLSRAMTSHDRLFDAVDVNFIDAVVA